MAGSLKVLAFAGARDVIGAQELNLPLAELGGEAPLTAGDVLDAICTRYPALTRYRAVIRIAVNGTYVELGAQVAAGDEVALIPPVAGG